MRDPLKAKADKLEEATRAKQRQKKHAEKLQQELTEALGRVANSDDGRIVLNAIYRLSGYALPLYPRQQTLDRTAADVNEGRRTMWIDIRSMIDKKYLKEIEYMERK